VMEGNSGLGGGSQPWSTLLPEKNSLGAFFGRVSFLFQICRILMAFVVGLVLVV